MTIQEIQQTYTATIFQVIHDLNIDVVSLGYSEPDYANIIAGIIWKESSGNPNALGDQSGAGQYCSYGLMQLNVCAGTPQGLGFSGDPNSLFDPYTNIYYGTKYFTQLLQQYGNLQSALSAYNAGSPILANISGYVDQIVSQIQTISGKVVTLAKSNPGVVLAALAGAAFIYSTVKKP